MQLVAASPGHIESDPIILSNINHGLAVNRKRGVNGEKIASVGDPYSGDDLDIASDNPARREIVFLHGHGSRGSYAGEFAVTGSEPQKTPEYTLVAHEVAQRLRVVTDNDKKGKSYKIRILTCHGGDPAGEEFGYPSLVTALKEKLAKSASDGDAFSYPGFKTHLDPREGSATDAIEKFLKAPFAQFKAWLEEFPSDTTPPGYDARLAKISALLPPETVSDFIAALRVAGGYTKKDFKERPGAPEASDFVKVSTNVSVSTTEITATTGT
jgi:hypothetical protein